MVEVTRSDNSTSKCSVVDLALIPIACLFFLDSEFITLSVRSLNKKNRYEELTMSDLEVVSSKTNIPKLDDTNYASWSSRMRAYLRSKDLYKVVTGEVTPADKKRHETANVLISHLGDTAFDSVITAENKDKTG
ncbi:hypothetical protein PCASD_24430 [Puccinia coronata f. sp. avenae]|uniref:DUF4219 domain-containing protein n=1 Tax=Puccinia coronata f. sp. avenae TaxID=200324 RepID=A0A2N5RYA1_9BASI|nr:hypothetical protein PCASD_24430 [Puccinia coronata f. sp. avenae]